MNNKITPFIFVNDSVTFVQQTEANEKITDHKAIGP
jgi:hypothetical protein